MNKDYVSLETAKLLKEVGLDLKCKFCYLYENYNDGEDILSELYNPSYNKVEQNFNNKDEFDTKYCKYYSQPHIYDAQKWLREVYKINVEITSFIGNDNDNKGDYVYGIGYHIIQLSGRYISNSILHQPSQEEYDNTYEQALDTAIQEACKLLIKDK